MDGDLDLSRPVLLAPSARNAFSDFVFRGGLDLSYPKGNRQKSPYATNFRKQRLWQCTVKISCLLLNPDKASPSLATTWLTKTKKKSCDKSCSNRRTRKDQVVPVQACFHCRGLLVTLPPYKRNTCLDVNIPQSCSFYWLKTKTVQYFQ